MVFYPNLPLPRRRLPEMYGFAAPFEKDSDVLDQDGSIMINVWRRTIGFEVEWDMIVDGLGPFEDLDDEHMYAHVKADVRDLLARGALYDDDAPTYIPVSWCNFCDRDRPCLVHGVEEGNVQIFCRRCFKPVRYCVYWMTRQYAVQRFGPRLYTPYGHTDDFALHRPEAGWDLVRYWFHRLLGNRLYVSR